MSWLLIAGCVTGDPGDSETGSDDTATTPVTEDACPLDVAPFTVQSCAETTAVFRDPPDTGYYGAGAVLAEGSGLVTEVGAALEAVPGSAALDGFHACGPEHTQQVRVVDDNGETWTFGWDLSGPVDDGSTAAIVAGSDLDFTVLWDFSYFSATGALLLSDALGPLFLFELEPVLTDVQRGGVSVAVDTADPCIVRTDEGDFEHYRVAFGWDGGEVELQSGQSALVPLPTRELEVVLGGSSWMLGCADGCGASWWSAWPESP